MTLGSGVWVRVLTGALVVLIIAQVSITAVSVSLRMRAAGTLNASALIDQTSAAARLLDTLEPGERRYATRALNSPFIRIRLIEEYPEATLSGDPLPIYRPIMAAFSAVLGDRPFQIYRRGPAPRRAFPRRSRLLALETRGVMIVVRLEDGSAMIVEPSGAYRRHMAINQLSVTSAILAIALLIALIWASVATSQPLRRMAASASSFARDLNSPAMAEQGPPDVRKLAKAFNEMQTQLRQLVSERTRTVAAIAHDMRTYLTRLRMRAEFIEDDIQRTKAVRDLDYMTALIGDTLAFAHEAEQPSPLEPVGIAALAKDLVTAHREAGANTEVAIADDARNALVLARNGSLARALSNVIENAVRYGGAAYVHVGAREDNVVVTVTDDGQDAPSGDLSRLTEPFYREESSRSRDTGGAGLGLAITRALVERSDGRLQLSRATNGGLKVEITLPRVKNGETGEEPA